MPRTSRRLRHNNYSDLLPAHSIPQIASTVDAIAREKRWYYHGYLIDMAVDLGKGLALLSQAPDGPAKDELVDLARQAQIGLSDAVGAEIERAANRDDYGSDDDERRSDDYLSENSRRRTSLRRNSRRRTSRRR